MNALEFTTQIEKGVIHLPKEYDEYADTPVRVILLFETPITVVKQKERLKNIFDQMKEKHLFDQIENPSEWQKKIRDEWE